MNLLTQSDIMLGYELKMSQKGLQLASQIIALHSIINHVLLYLSTMEEKEMNKKEIAYT